eukprot:TRINITY_DN78370_c0_g1_i1.p1 TRINITY_DN78370_c0_g1~~TRINITY_DN78370_c0_g1_i1.p1  ORF type:complete len:405 (-),score=48.37 TRINITY_DN78370_c0_g1_i1:44-1258(-)
MMSCIEQTRANVHIASLFLSRNTFNAATTPARLNVEISRLRNAVDVVQLCEEHMPRFDVVNVATALHRIAKLSARRSDRSALLQTDTARLLLERAAHAAKSHEFNSQCLANTVWSLATLSWEDKPLLETLSATTQAKVSNFQAQELANTSWAFATLDYFDTTLLEALSNASSSKLSSFSTQQLSNTAWAFATSRWRPLPLLSDIALLAMHEINEFQAQGLANMAWAFVTLEVLHQPLLATIAEVSIARQAEFQPQHLASTAWAFAEADLGHHSDDHLYDALSSAALETITQFNSRELGSTILAFSQKRGFSLAWPLFLEADRLGLKVGMSGTSALLGRCESGPCPSRRCIVREMRLLLRCRGPVRTLFNVAAAFRAAEVGNAPKALQLLDRCQAWADRESDSFQ